MAKKLFFFAGEASGDQHASVMIRKLKAAEPDTEILCWGGDKMQAAGAVLLSHYKDRNIMGLVEVIKNLGLIRRFMQQAREDILQYRPDKVVFVDNPGFNLPLAKYAHSLGIFVHWYIAPKAWAWNEGRIKTMRKVIDQLDVIFPFEVEFFSSRGMPCTYVGNPTYEAVKEFSGESLEGRVEGGEFRGESVEFSQLPAPNDQRPTPKDQGPRFKDQGPVIALLPGSRPAEVSSLLPSFIKAVQLREEANERKVTIKVAGAPSLSQEFYENILRETQLEAHIVFDKTFDILHAAAQSGGYALVASGTATLETALFGCPQLVAYKVSPLTYFVGKYLFRIQHVSLVNILLKRQAVQEILQDVSPERLSRAIDEIDPNSGEIRREIEALLSNSRS
jgi:lipid-A-disaccharide synthase